MRKLLSMMFYQIGHNIDRLLWMNSPTYEWVEDKFADLYQWSMRRSIKYDVYNEIWQYDNQITR
jgi:hypothetical protein